MVFLILSYFFVCSNVTLNFLLYLLYSWLGSAVRNLELEQRCVFKVGL